MESFEKRQTSHKIEIFEKHTDKFIKKMKTSKNALTFLNKKPQFHKVC